MNTAATPDAEPKLDRMSLRTTPLWFSRSGPFEPSPGNGPAVSSGIPDPGDPDEPAAAPDAPDAAVPAAVALWIRRRVREPETWAREAGKPPRLAEQCHAIGYYPLFIGPSPIVVDKTIELGGKHVDGMMGVEVYPLPTEPGPFLDLYRADMKKYFPNLALFVLSDAAANLNGAILGMSRAEIRRKFDAIVEFAEITRFLDDGLLRLADGAAGNPLYLTELAPRRACGWAGGSRGRAPRDRLP